MRVFTFRLGVLVGGGIGYVLGSRAGRQRYEQIASWGRSATRSRPAQQLGTELRETADRTKQLIGEKATEQVSRVTNVVRDKLPGGDGGQPETAGLGTVEPEAR